jgi:UDP-GlcNAc:undecaprenyl-phosphate GlcNAc-1-phosphate transferase
MTATALDVVPIVISFAGVVTLTPLVRALAQRHGFVARPQNDRWHRKPTAMLGGVAIFTSVAIVALTLVPVSPRTLIVVAASALLFAVGQIDDLIHLNPGQKLIGQVIGGGLVVSFGLTLPWTGSPLLDGTVTLLWLVGITNALNLLDNMDGLAAGIAAIASVFLALVSLGSGRPDDALLMAVFGAALAGFLVYNAAPASIFMGDCGSMFVGFFLASAALLGARENRDPGVVATLSTPILILLIPIFDMLLVIVLRTLAGRSIARGGRDHSSHRLVALGLSERQAVWMLYGLAVVAGGLGLLVQNVSRGAAIVMVLCFVLVLAVFGVHLGRVNVYEKAESCPAARRPSRRLRIGPAATRFS